MTIEDLRKKSVGILGFGQEGQAVFAYLQKHNITAKVFDELENEEFPNIISGENYLDRIGECEVLFRSPGIWRRHPKILAAENSGSIITSQVKWFFENSPAKIIGVTGTKGKGTTCFLIYNILKEAGASVYLTGNIGKIQPLEFLDDVSANDWIVYELSSFQLQDLNQSPYIGVCLMVTSDHLNHHSDLGEYHSAKSAITAFQKETDIAIYNTDYDASRKIGQLGHGTKLQVSSRTQPEAGAYISENNIELISNQGHQSLKINCSDRKLRGQHNLENIAPACLVAMKVGIPIDLITKVIKEFTGLEHRLQFVGNFSGTSYYNDSISTIPETTVAAVKSFTEPIHLLLGGSDKGLDYTNLILELSNHNIASITLLGEVGEKIKDKLEEKKSFQIFGPYSDFKLAITEIKRRVKPGEVVLLSPASASFDMFKNYKDRGEQFVELVTNQGN